VFPFFARKQHVDIAPYLRRICDRTAPNNGSTPQLDRKENRYNRTLPVLIWPWQNDGPLIDQCVIAITKDVTDHGMGIILRCEFDFPEMVLALLSGEADEAEPWFFLGHVVRSELIGGGYTILGVELTQFLNRDGSEAVEPLLPEAKKLLRAVAS
jgi:hypothetical protein